MVVQDVFLNVPFLFVYILVIMFNLYLHLIYDIDIANVDAFIHCSVHCNWRFTILSKTLQNLFDVQLDKYLLLTSSILRKLVPVSNFKIN